MDCDRCNPWPIRDNKLRSGRILQLRCKGEMPTIDLANSRKASIMITNRFYCIFDDPLILLGIFQFLQTPLYIFGTYGIFRFLEILNFLLEQQVSNFCPESWNLLRRSNLIYKTHKNLEIVVISVYVIEMYDTYYCALLPREREREREKETELIVDALIKPKQYEILCLI